MGKAILSFFFLALLAVSDLVSAASQTLNVNLVVHNQRSSSGTRSTLVWKDCGTITGTVSAPCIDFSVPNSWQSNNQDGSTMRWTWTPSEADPLNGTIAGTGFYQATSFINSRPNGTPVISDKVTDLVINTTASTTTFALYECIEGTFLAGVGASGCYNVNLGDNSLLESVAEWNVGGDPFCVTMEIAGDDFSLTDGHKATVSPPQSFFAGTPVPRGGHAVNAGDRGVGCVKTSGGFDLWTVIDPHATGAPIPPGLVPDDVVMISNGTPVTQCTLPVDINCQGANWMTFEFAPTSSNDSVTAPQGVATQIDVLANDSYLTPNVGALAVNFVAPVTLTVQTPPTKGSAVPSAGKITYTSNPTATGTDTFVYKAVDANGDFDTATVTVHILAGGANDDEANTHVNTPVAINVGTNDTGLTDPVTITIVTPPAIVTPPTTGTTNPGPGVATPGAAGPAASATINYTPATVSTGTDSYDVAFTYQVTDATAATTTAVVTVHVNNLLPNAANGNSTQITTQGLAPLGRTATFAAPAPGGSLGDPPSAIGLGSQGTKGTVQQSGNTFTYTITSADFFAGNDTFTYTVTDSDGETSVGTVTVTIPDKIPILAPGVIATSAGVPGSIALGITAGNGTIAQHTAQVTAGSCTLSGIGTATITVTYTPAAGFSGSDTCTVAVKDGDLSTASNTITVSVTGSGGGGGGGGGPQLPGGSSALDPWSLGLLSLALALRRRRVAGRGF